MFSDNFCVSELDFTSRHKQQSQQRAMLIIGITAAILFYLYMSSPMDSGFDPMNMRRKARRLAAMIATTAGSGTNVQITNANSVYSVIPTEALVHLVHDAQPRVMTDADRQAKLDLLTTYLAAHPIAVMMVYSDSCPHCHNAMPHFAQAVGPATVHATMVSGDCLPRDFAMNTLKLEFYPTFIVANNGEFEKMGSIDEAIARYTQLTTAPAATAPAEAAEEPVSARRAGTKHEASDLSAERGGDIFADLF